MERLDDRDTDGERVRLGVFEVDFERRELWRGGERVAVQEKPLQLLEALVRRRGEVVSREELHRILWPEAQYLDFENNLNVAARKLREALGESAAEPVWVHTVPRQGYRLGAAAPATTQEAAGPRRRRVSPALALAWILGLVVAVAAGWWWSGHRTLERLPAVPAGENATGAAEPSVLRLRLAPVTAASPELEEAAQELARQLAMRVPVLRPGRLVLVDSADRAPAPAKEGSEEPRGPRPADVELRATVALDEGRRTVHAEAVDLDSGAVLWSFARPPEPHESLARGVLRRLPFRLLPPQDAILAIVRDAAFEATAAEPSSLRLAEIEKGERSGDSRAAVDLAWAELLGGRRWGRAEEIFRSVLADDPTNEEAQRGLLALLTALGRTDPATELLRGLPPAADAEEALRRGWTWLRLGRFEEATSECTKALEDQAGPAGTATPRLDDGTLFSLYCRELAELRGGHSEAAYEHALETLAPRFRTPEDRRPEGVDAWTQLRLDRLASTQHGTPFGPAHAWRLAYDAAELGEPDVALAWLERGLSDGDEVWIFLAVDPAFEALRGDPRFAEMVARTLAPRGG